MGKLIEILGVTKQTDLPKDILVAEALIIGMQEVYANSPESYRKKQLANAIAELTRNLMEELRKIDIKQEVAVNEEDIVVGRIYRNLNNMTGFYVDEKVQKYSGSTLIGVYYEIIWNEDTGAGSKPTYKMRVKDDDTLITELSEWQTLDLIKEKWYKGVYVSPNNNLEYLFCYDDIHRVTEDGYIKVKCSTLFWGGINGDDTIMANNQALIFCEEAEKEDIKKFFIKQAQKNYPALFDDEGKIKDDVEFHKGSVTYTTKGGDYLYFSVKGKQANLTLEMDTGTSLTLYDVDGWADLQFNTPTLEVGKWYYSDSYVSEFHNEPLKVLMRVSGVQNVTSTIHNYNRINYSDRFIKRGDTYGYDKNSGMANTGWEKTFRVVNNKTDDDAIQGLIEGYIRFQEPYKVGDIVDNSNLGEGETNAEIQHSRVVINYGTRYLFFSIGGIRIYDDDYDVRWANKVIQQQAPPNQIQRAGRRKSKPQPDTDPTSVAEGTIEVGNDGNRYVARKGGDGQNRWSKIK